MNSCQANDDLRDKVFQLLNRHSEASDIEKTCIRDYLSRHWLNTQIHSVENSEPDGFTVFFAVGNSFQKNKNSWSERQYEDVVSAVRSLVEEGYRIAYDKDSPVLTQIIRDHVDPRYRLGISGKNKPSSTHGVVIQNPWMYLDNVLKFKHIVITPDSLVGTALVLKAVPMSRGRPRLYILESNTSHWAFDKIKSWSGDLQSGRSTYHPIPNQSNNPSNSSIQAEIENGFNKVTGFFNDLIRKFGFLNEMPIPSGSSQERVLVNFRISYPSDQFPLQFNEENHRLTIQGRESRSFPVFHLETYVENLSDSVLEKALVFVNNYRDHSHQINQRLPKGVVIFGSGSDDPLYRPLLESSVELFTQEGKLPIATGGAGGYMAVANRVAMANGVESIGIPRKLKNDTPLEFEVSSQFHTRTIQVDDYDERIPHLLSRGEVSIVFAPGGPGTIQELATTLVYAAAQGEKISPLIFLDQDYYYGLVTWLKNLPIPSVVREKIYLVNQAQDLRKLNSLKRFL